MTPQVNQTLPPLRPSPLPRAVPRLEKGDRLLQRIMIFLPVGVLASLAYSTYRTDFSELPHLLKVNPEFLLLAVVLVLLPLLTNTIRLGNWLRFLNRPASFADTFRVTLVGELGAAVSPTALGAGPVTVAMLVRRGLSLGKSASLLGLATLENAIFTLTAVPVGLIVTGAWRLPLWSHIRTNSLSPVWWVIIGALAIILVAAGYWLLKRSGRPGVTERWRKFVADVRTIGTLVGRRGMGTLALNVVLAAIQWTARYSVVSALLWGLGIEADPLRLAVIQWMCFTAMTLIPTPGAAGGAEAAFLLFYAGLIAPEIIALAMFFWRFLTFYFLSGLAIVIYLVMGPGKRATE